MRAARTDLARMTPIMIASEIYRNSRYGAAHPLGIPRVSTCVDLCRALGWLPEAQYRDSPVATREELIAFHAPDYVDALIAAERDGAAPEEVEERYRLNRDGNPIFAEIFSRPATACGGGLLAVDLLMAGGTVHSPGGGTHHGRPDRASGFCYLNEPALTMLKALERGARRIAYVDLDAHRGDGVEDAFADDPRVLTISLHERDRWPGGGGEGWRRDALGALNLPMPEGAHDDDLALLIDAVVLPAVSAHRPDLLVLQCGADAVREDPLSRLACSNTGLWAAVRALLPLSPRRLLLGGGGYNPWSVGRAWAGLWGLINDQPIPDPLPQAAQAVLRGLRWSRAAGRNPPQSWLTTLADDWRGGVPHDAVRALARSVGEQA